MDNLLFLAFLLLDTEVVHCLFESRRIKVEIDLLELLDGTNVPDIVIELDLVLFFLLELLVAPFLLEALLLEPLLLFPHLLDRRHFRSFAVKL